MKVLSKSQYRFRWLFVIICTFTMMCGLYAYSNFAASHDYFKELFKYEFSDSQFEFYYNVSYSIALFALVFAATVVGALCDKYGSCLVMLYQWIIFNLGEWLILFSVRYVVFIPILIGRVLIICGSQSL